MNEEEKKIIINLVQQAQAGKDGAKSELYNLLYERIRNYCNCCYLTNFHDAEEVANKAFSKTFEKIDTVQSPAFLSYLYVATIHCSINFLKKKQKEGELFINGNQDAIMNVSDHKAENPRVVVSFNEMLLRLDNMVETLKPIHRIIFKYRKDGYTYKEISNKAKKNHSSIRTESSRLQKLLKKKFDNKFIID